MANDILKIEGLVILPEETKQDFINDFSKFLKNRNVEFSGNIGKDFIRTGKERAVIPVDTLNLSDRLKRILYSEKVFDLGELSTYYEEDIMNFHGLGVTGYQELFSVLKEYGIHPVSYMEETKELKFFYRWEKRELYENNIRTLEDVYALSEADIACMFDHHGHIYQRLITIKKKHTSDANRKG